MTAQSPLQGIALIDCAKANVKQGLAVAAQQCGYGENIDQFRNNLQQACQEIGVDLQTFTDLLSTDQYLPKEGVKIAPDSPSNL